MPPPKLVMPGLPITTQPEIVLFFILDECSLEGKMDRLLKFHATSVGVSLEEEVQTLSFQVNADGDPTIYLSIMNEVDPSNGVRIWWGDGVESRDECTTKIVTVLLEPGRFSGQFEDRRPSCLGGYAGFDISFQAPEDEEMESLMAALQEATITLFPLEMETIG